MSGTLAKTEPIHTLRDLLERSKAQIALALPKHLTPERMIRVAITAFQATPGLQECSPLSIVGGVIQAAALGLELTGPLGQAYLVPFYNKNSRQKEAQFIVGYRGFIDLAYRSGRVDTFCAHAVRANDVFDYDYGSKSFLRHKPARSERGEITDVYAILRMKGGGFDFEVMSAQDIEAHRKKYSKQTSEYSPWVTAWEEMAKKTPIRRLAKRAPLSVELVKAAVLDEMGEHGVSQQLTAGLEAGFDSTAARPMLVGNGRFNGTAPTEQLDEASPNESPSSTPADPTAAPVDDQAEQLWTNSIADAVSPGAVRTLRKELDESRLALGEELYGRLSTLLNTKHMAPGEKATAGNGTRS